VHAVQEFAKANNKDGLEFILAAGNAGIEAATNEVIKESELTILILVYICVATMCMITFRSWAATLCIVLPLVLTSVLGNALMAFMGIGVKVATLPVVALGWGLAWTTASTSTAAWKASCVPACRCRRPTTRR
jgi:predicted RND superfamily exporter protein